MFVKVVFREEADARDTRIKVNLERLVEVGPLKLKAFGRTWSIIICHGKVSFVKILRSGQIDSKFKYVLI